MTEVPDSGIKVLGALALLALVALFFRNKLNHEVSANPVLIKASIDNITFGKPPTIFMDYSFCYNHKKYSKTIAITHKFYNKRKMDGLRYVWVIAAKTNPDNNTAMYDNEMFKEFNVNAGDTLHIEMDSTCVK